MPLLEEYSKEDLFELCFEQASEENFEHISSNLHNHSRWEVTEEHIVKYKNILYAIYINVPATESQDFDDCQDIDIVLIDVKEFGARLREFVESYGLTLKNLRDLLENQNERSS